MILKESIIEVIQTQKSYKHLWNIPWFLVDYRSLSRLHPVYQQGWNRKGILSERGDKKKAWYIMQDFYRKMK